MAQWLACWAHNPKVRGSNLRSANLKTAWGARAGDLEAQGRRFEPPWAQTGSAKILFRQDRVRSSDRIGTLCPPHNPPFALETTDMMLGLAVPPRLFGVGPLAMRFWVYSPWSLALLCILTGDCNLFPLQSWFMLAREEESNPCMSPYP